MTTPLDDDEMTELHDADFPRVDLVGKGANGIPRFLITKQDDDSRGLVPPDMIRDLIGKQADPDLDPESDQVTMTGSPAAIAKLIHEAGQKPPAEVEVEKAKNDTADRKHKAATGAAMENGSYPIANESDLHKAIHAVGRGGSSHNAIRKHIISRARSLGASSAIPDNWNSDGSLKGDSVSKTATETVIKDNGPELDDGVDGLDPTVPLAAPDEDAPGDPTDPGSPAWEAIDAATAQKWTSILARAQVAIELLGEREMLESASADPGDAENAWDMQDVCSAIDYAISVLAPYAVAEQSEVDCGTADMEAIGKAIGGFDPAPLAALEGLSAVRKSGRVLSSANEAVIREAAAGLQKVLASLPAAPQTTDSGQPVAAQKETAMAATETSAPPAAEPEVVEKAEEALAADAPARVKAGMITGSEGGINAARSDHDLPPIEVAKAALRSAVFVYGADGQLAGLIDPARITQQVVKADTPEGKVTMQAVFDESGNLVGIVDPADITPVSGAGSNAADDGGSADGAEAPGSDAPAADASMSDDAATDMPAPDAADLTPAPSADAGTPADAVADDGTVKKQDDTATNEPDFAEQVAKSVAEAIQAALTAQSATHEETVAKQAAVIEEMAGQVDVLKGRIEEIAEQPAAPRVFMNGQTPPPGTLRGQDQGAPPVDVAKALARKRDLYTAADATEQNKIAKEMQSDAIDALAAVHRR